jgi:DNA-binding GntR family transcriptional regulator
VALREHRARLAAGGETGPALAEPRRLLPVQPRTMVEQAAEAIVGAAARGVFLPGDRLVEAEIARDLGISRVPVREALRLLESQGIVVSTPYKGMRLMQVSNASVAEVMRVRLALETLALQEALRRPGGPERFVGLRRFADAYAHAQETGDPAAVVAAEEAFHGELCRCSGNAPLAAVWNSLARQLAVVWGLGQAARSMAESAAEHDGLIAALERGDLKAATGLLTVHVNWHMGFDFEAALDQRRRQPSG